MIGRIWTATKAALGIAMLVALALYSAQRLDRDHMADLSRQAAHIADPVTTGSIKAKEPHRWR